MLSRACLTLALLLPIGCAQPAQDTPPAIACGEDRFGASDDTEARATLDVGQFDDLVVCADASDRFLLARQDVQWTLSIEAEAPVSVVLWDGEQVQAREQGRDLIFDRVAMTAFEVSGENTAYRLVLALDEGPSAECVEGVHRSISIGSGGGRICQNGEALLRPRVAAGDRLELRLSGDGVQWVEVFEKVGAEEVRTDRFRGQESVIFRRTQPRLDAVSLRLSGTPGSDYQVRLITETQDLESISLTGRVEVEAPTVLGDGLGPRVPFSLEGARLDLSNGTGRVSTGRVGAEGVFAMDALVPRGDPITLGVMADVALATDNGPTVAIRVAPEADGDPWTAQLFSGAYVDLPTSPLGVPSESAAEAALRVASVAAAGLATLSPHLSDRDAPALTYRWRQGTAEDCGTCFRPGERPYIDLSGRVSDPDQWDDSVIFHELGHYVAAVYGQDDSQGGPHDGRRTVPTLAWSEGFAIFMASVLTGRSLQLDYKLATVKTFDVEAADGDAAFGTVDDDPAGAVSEHLVAAILWDFFDGPDVDDDEMSLPLAAVLAAAFSQGSADDRGAPGYDLVDYLDALWCRQTGQRAAIEGIVEARDFPYSPPPACPG